MKKKNILISGLLVLLGILVLPYETNALAQDSVFVCGNELYYIDSVGRSDESGINQYTMIYYDTTNADGSSAGKTYCINPGMLAPSAATRVYRCNRVINPTESNVGGRTYQALDVALTKAYQILYTEGLVGTSARERYIGELVFRWLYTNYGGIDQPTTYSSASAVLNKFLHRYDGDLLDQRWYEGNDNVQTAIRIMKEAVSVGNLVYGGTKTYNQLIEEGYLWGDQWSFTTSVNSENISGNEISMNIHVTAVGSAPESNYWNNWTITCGNGYTCSITGVEAISNSEANFTVSINTAGATSGDYGMILTSSYYDPRDGTANMLELFPTVNPNKVQRMLIVTSGTPSIDRDTPSGSNPNTPGGGTPGGGGETGHDHKVEPNSSCYCDEATGIYHYYETQTSSDSFWETDKDGNIINQGESSSTSSGIHETCDTTKEDCTNFVNEHGSCPGTCTKNPNIGSCKEYNGKYYCTDGKECPEEQYRKECKHSCEITTDSSTGYYCEDGSECNEDEYREQCTHTCEISDKSPTGYYCKESSPGAGDGQPCTEMEYRVQCDEDAVNCYPTIDLPSSCNDLSNNIEGIANGTVSDINEVASSCNPDINQIKKCVLGGTDLTGESFEATNEMKDNPYCKVYCKEKYDFVLPTAQITQSGGYFTLSTTITGERDCYTASADDPTQPIDSEKFQSDLVEAQHAVIDAWNEYNHWVEGTNPEHMWTTTESDSDDGCVQSHESCSTTCDAQGNCSEDCDTVCDEYCDASGEWTIVHHEWDYTVYNYDGTTSTRHQAEITDGGGECWTCGCTGSEGNGESQIPVFQQNADKAKNTLKDAITKLNRIISQYNSCSGAVTNTSNTNISGVSSAASTEDSSWVNDMIFEPQVDFWYNQDYMNQGFNGTFVEDSRESEVSKNMYCSGDVDDQYNCTSGETPSVATTTQAILTCDDSGCSWKNFNISTAKWVQKTKINEGTYISGNEFSTYTQYGTIKLGYDGCNGRDCLLTDLPAGSLPISLITKTGVFPFTFTFSHIGQSNSNNSTGRLIDGTKNSTISVIEAYQNIPDSLKCSNNVNASVDGGYVCHYLNNCGGPPDCEFTCEEDDPGNCTFTVCDEGECVVTCENCIFDGGKAVYSYRTVTLNNLFPNGLSGRSYNWDNVKGRATMEAVEEDGDEIYQTPQYSYTLTPTNMRNIREYNDLAGSFTNSRIPDDYAAKIANSNAVYCEHYEFNGLNYSINCRSSFLDLIDETGKTFATDVTRVTQEDDAFELFDQSKCSTGQYGSGDCEYVGPSWRLKGSSNE